MLFHDDAVDQDEGGHHVQGLVVQQPQHNDPEHLLDLLKVPECPKLGLAALSANCLTRLNN